MRRLPAAVVLGALTLAGCGSGSPDPPSPESGGAARPASEAADPHLPPEGPVRRLGGAVVRPVQLRAAPGGRVVRTLRQKTGLGGRQILAIVARRGDWFGVLHHEMPNGRAGWVPVDSLEVVIEPWEIVVDRSSHELRLMRYGEEHDRFPVAVGRPGSHTPVGRFAVTDRLKPPSGSPYGCCILALSGRQTHLPPGWSGGDRLALHGTPTDVVGGAFSSGCVRVREADLRKLMDRIPVGTRVTVQE